MKNVSPGGSDNEELLRALDYILNRAHMREIDALEAAVERRRKFLTGRTGVISLDPQRAAREMTDAVQDSLLRGMEGMKNTFRNFAFDLLDKEAPDLPEAEKKKLVDSWIPRSSPAGGKRPSAARLSGGCAGLAENGKIGGIPCDAFEEMVRQFVAYSTGKMPPRDEAELRDTIGDWPSAYWRAFPPQIQKAVKALLSGEWSPEEFEAVLAVLLR